MPRHGRRVALWCAILCAAGLGGAVLLSRQTLLELWYLRQLDASESSDRITAIRVLGEIRSRRAVPGLLEIARSSSRSEFFEAMKAFALIGERAADAAPALLQTYFQAIDTSEESIDLNPASAVCHALAGIGQPAVPHLLHALESAVDQGHWSNVQTRRRFRRIFRAFGSEAGEGLMDALGRNPELGIAVDECLVSQGLSALPLLFDRLASSSTTDQLWAENAAWQICTTSPAGVKSVAEAFLEAREPLRARLLRVLELTVDFGRDVLLESQGSGDPNLRRAARLALNELIRE